MNYERVIFLKARVSCTVTTPTCSFLGNRISLSNFVRNHSSSANVVQMASNISDGKMSKTLHSTSRNSMRLRIRPSASSDEYNQMMTRQMKNPYEYHHELGEELLSVRHQRLRYYYSRSTTLHDHSRFMATANVSKINLRD